MYFQCLKRVFLVLICLDAISSLRMFVCLDTLFGELGKDVLEDSCRLDGLFTDEVF